MNSNNNESKSAFQESKALSRNEDKNRNTHKDLNINTTLNLNNLYGANRKEDEIYKTVKNKNFQELKLNEFNFLEPLGYKTNHNIKTNTNFNNVNYSSTKILNTACFNNSCFLNKENNQIKNEADISIPLHSIMNLNGNLNNNNNNNNSSNNTLNNNNNNNNNLYNNTLKISAQSKSNFEFKIMNENNIEILADSKNERKRNSNVFSNHSNHNNIESDSFNVNSNSSNNTNNAFVSNSSANNMNSTHPASSNNNSNLVLENLSTEELKIHLENAKRIYEKKLLDTDQLIKEINTKDVRICELTSELKSLLETEMGLESSSAQANFNLAPHENNEIIKSNFNVGISSNNMNNRSFCNAQNINKINCDTHLNANNEINYEGINSNNYNHYNSRSNYNNNDSNQRVNFKKKEISDLNLEINNIKRNHSDLIQQIEKEYDKELELNINKLKDLYEKKISEMSEEQDKKIKELQQEIYLIKNKINQYENFYINKFNSNYSHQQYNSLFNSGASFNNIHNNQDNDFILNQPNQYLLNLKKV